MKTEITLLTALVACLLGPAAASANIHLRVSVKFILNSSGQRPSGGLATDDDVRQQILRGNEVLARAGAGYELELTEIAEVSGASQWFSVDARDSGQRLQLQNAALLNSSLYRLRANAVNIYINRGRRAQQHRRGQPAPDPSGQLQRASDHEQAHVPHGGRRRRGHGPPLTLMPFGNSAHALTFLPLPRSSPERAGVRASPQRRPVNTLLSMKGCQLIHPPSINRTP